MHMQDVISINLHINVGSTRRRGRNVKVVSWRRQHLSTTRAHTHNTTVSGDTHTDL